MLKKSPNASINNEPCVFGASAQPDQPVDVNDPNERANIAPGGYCDTTLRPGMRPRG